MLKIKSLNVSYGFVHVLKDASLEVGEGRIVSLIGANGAGKTTLLRTISGLVKSTSGTIEMQGANIAGLKPHEVVKRGVIHVPEGRRVFPEMTVEENLEMGAFSWSGRSTDFREDLGRVYNLFPRLLERKTQAAGTLSGGEQQMLAMGRALMSHPRVLLLDEPSMGLAPNLVTLIFELISQIRNETGTTILLVEQNALMALRIADYAYVLETGSIVLEGSGAALLKDKRVREAYLGAARQG